MLRICSSFPFCDHLPRNNNRVHLVNLTVSQLIKKIFVGLFKDYYPVNVSTQLDEIQH
jgi:hypothetical protein